MFIVHVCSCGYLVSSCTVLKPKGPTIQKLALAAKRTYNDRNAADVNFIASLGSYGAEPQNITSALMDTFCIKSASNLPEPYTINLPVLVKDMHSQQIRVEKQPYHIFLPHDWLGSFGSHAALCKVWGLDTLESFWSKHKVTDDPSCRKLQEVLKKKKLIPLLIHGDAGQFQREGSLLVMSMRSLLSSANVGHSQMLLAAISKACVSKSVDPCLDTMQCLWEVLSWSFKALLQGQHPVADHEGNPFPTTSWRHTSKGKPLLDKLHCACIFVISGDGEYFQNELKLPGYSSNNCCKDCGANKSDVPHNDYRPTAKWRGTLRTPLQNDTDPPSNHALLKVAGVVPEMIQYDILHVIEEGTSSHAIANCLFDFVVMPSKSKYFIGTQEQKLKQLNEKIMQLQKHLKISADRRSRPLSFTSFCTPSGKHTHFPDMSGLKARHIRYLVPVVAAICKEEVAADDMYSYHRLQMMESLSKLCDIIDTSDFHHFDEEEVVSFTNSVQMFLAHYTKCCRCWYDKGFKYRYNTVHKFHCLAHMPEKARFLNPRCCSTYSGETMVGFIATLAHACLNGTPAHMISYKLCWRWRLSFDLRLELED